MQRTLITAWPLFVGLAVLMAGSGLQGTLLGVRATLEGFETATTGLIMSLYYAGYFLGFLYVPKLVSGVGHIRVFTAMASLASAAVLVNGLFSEPVIWGVLRIVSGFCYAGLFIVVESWLNNISTNENRGKILSLYLFVMYLSMVGGQFLLNLADPGGPELFILVSVLVSLALLPIALSTRPAPELETHEPISLRRLYIMSPLGLFGAFASGIGAGAVFGIGAVYAANSGLSVVQVSIFIAAYIIGGAIFQIPVGWISDRYDRRRVLIIVSALTVLAALICFLADLLSSEQGGWKLYTATVMFGGMSLSIYPLCLAHTNDHLTHHQIVGAGSSLIMVNGVGAVMGPLLVSLIMTFSGPQGFFPLMAFIFATIFLFGLFRTQIRAPVPLEDQGDYIAVPVRASPIVLQIAEESTPVSNNMDE